MSQRPELRALAVALVLACRGLDGVRVRLPVSDGANSFVAPPARRDARVDAAVVVEKDPDAPLQQIQQAAQDEAHAERVSGLQGAQRKDSADSITGSATSGTGKLSPRVPWDFGTMPPCTDEPCQKILPIPGEVFQPGDVVMNRGFGPGSSSIMTFTQWDVSHSQMITKAENVDFVSKSNQLLGVNLKSTDSKFQGTVTSLWWWNAVSVHTQLRVYRACCWHPGLCPCHNTKANKEKALDWMEQQLGKEYNNEEFQSRIPRAFVHHAVSSARTGLSALPEYLTAEKEKAIADGKVKYVCSSLVAQALAEGGALDPRAEKLNVTMVTPRQEEQNLLNGLTDEGYSIFPAAALIYQVNEHEPLPWHAQGDSALIWRVTHKRAVTCLSADAAKGIAKDVMTKGIHVAQLLHMSAPRLSPGDLVRAHHAYDLLPKFPHMPEAQPRWWELQDGEVKPEVPEALLQYNMIILHVDQVLESSGPVQCGCGDDRYVVLYGENIQKPLFDFAADEMAKPHTALECATTTTEEPADWEPADWEQVNWGPIY